MKNNSFLPGFESFSGPGRLGKFLRAVKACTLSKIEERLSAFLPADLLAGPSPTERPYSRRRTFWCLVFQMLSGNASCDEVVRQLQAMLELASPTQKAICAGNSAYCQARARLPEPVLEQAIEQSARSAWQLAGTPEIFPGKRTWLIDGTTVALPDTPENQEAFPQLRFQKKGCGFPLMRVLALCPLKGGAVLKTAVGNFRQHELRLMQEFMPVLGSGDVVIYDRIAGNYAVAARLKEQGVDLISRVARRRIDFRKGKRLGKDDALFEWPKGAVKSAYLSQEEWDRLPATIQVRVIRVRIKNKRFRSRQILLVTTLLDPLEYPAEQIARAYLYRWRIELCMKDLKITLGMDKLRCLSPATVKRELYGILIGYNLVRCVMAQAARTHAVPIERISVKGTIDSFRHFAAAMAQAPSAKMRRQLWDRLLLTLAERLVPLRPGRREPRVVKRRPKNYPRMKKPRHEYQHFRALNAY